MSISVVMIKDGEVIRISYPASTFEYVFSFLDKDEKWNRNSSKLALSYSKPLDVLIDIDRAVSNIDNLGLY